MCPNIRGLLNNMSGLSLTPRNFHIILCIEKCVLSIRSISEILALNFNKPLLMKQGPITKVRGINLYISLGYCAAHLSNPFSRYHDI